MDRATFFIADGIQNIAAGSLRGMNHTRVPLVFAAISCWLIGFTTAGMMVSGLTLAPAASGSAYRSAPRSMRHL
jgi:Na+-driven multidrug efflux pump